MNALYYEDDRVNRHRKALTKIRSRYAIKRPRALSKERKRQLFGTKESARRKRLKKKAEKQTGKAHQWYYGKLYSCP